MSKSIKFELDQSSFRTNVLQADFMKRAVTSEAEKQAGGGTVKPFIGFDRAKAFVYGDKNKK